MRWAHDESCDVVTRLEFAMAARVNSDGHAQFKPGELAMILGTETDRGREPLGLYSMSRALGDAKRRGRVLPPSSVRCLIAPPTVTRGAAGRGCRIHGVST